MLDYPMPKIVTREEWGRVRAEFLTREKAHTHAGDALAAARRRLPITAVENVSVVGVNGEVSLLDVFGGRRVLMVYHFMWNAGRPHERQCPGCTHTQVAMTDQVCAYLAARDVSYAVFSAGPIEQIVAYRDFMGWKTPWYSTAAAGPSQTTRDGGDLRIYLRDVENIYLSYDNKWRGVEPMLPTLQLLDLTPFGRQETWEDSPTGTPQEKSGSWWKREGRAIAQWTRTSEPAAPKT